MFRYGRLTGLAFLWFYLQFVVRPSLFYEFQVTLLLPAIRFHSFLSIHISCCHQFYVSSLFPFDFSGISFIYTYFIDATSFLIYWSMLWFYLILVSLATHSSFVLLDDLLILFSFWFPAISFYLSIFHFCW